MLQRIQTIYLLLATVALVFAMILPIGALLEPDFTAYTIKNLGITVGDQFQSTWGLFAILVLSTIITFGAIFMFKNRVLQLRMGVFASILLVGYYLAFLAFYFLLRTDALAFQLKWALCLPLVAIIFNYLAVRAIGRDEAMVHAADRLR